MAYLYTDLSPSWQQKRHDKPLCCHSVQTALQGTVSFMFCTAYACQGGGTQHQEKGLQGTRELSLSRFLASPSFKVSIAKLQPVNTGVWYVPS
jgi:hypothetical protein